MLKIRGLLHLLRGVIAGAWFQLRRRLDYLVSARSRLSTAGKVTSCTVLRFPRVFSLSIAVATALRLRTLVQSNSSQGLLLAPAYLGKLLYPGEVPYAVPKHLEAL